MTKELLDRANRLYWELDAVKVRLCVAKLDEERMARFNNDVISRLQEQYDKLQAEFDALGNGGEQNEQQS